MELKYTRRLQVINDCVFVSLPKVWARAHKLERGNSINVLLLEDGSLKISLPEVEDEDDVH